jgi:hypothetical protein
MDHGPVLGKYDPKPGDTWVIIGSDIASFIVRFLEWILFRFPWKMTFSHVAKIVDNETTIEANTKGVSMYPLKMYRKAKRIVVFRHPAYSTKENLEKYTHLCREVVSRHWGYAYVNYFKWYFTVGALYLFMMPLMPMTWTMRLIIFGAFFLIYFPLSRMFKSLQKKTSHCAELAARIDQQHMEINMGVLDYEHITPNGILQTCTVSWQKVADFSPAQGEWFEE